MANKPARENRRATSVELVPPGRRAGRRLDPLDAGRAQRIVARPGLCFLRAEDVRGHPRASRRARSLRGALGSTREHMGPAAWHLSLPRPPAGWATAAAVPRRDLREKTLRRATEGQRLMRSVRAQEDRARIHRVCARRRSPLQRRDRRTVPRSPNQNAALSHSQSFDDFGDSSAFAGPGSSSRRAAAALVMRIIECAGAAARECASAIACAP